MDRLSIGNFTIIRSKYDDGYGILYGEKKPLWEYNGKRFSSVKDAKKNAEYLAFLLYNNKKCKRYLFFVLKKYAYKNNIFFTSSVS
jgi:hypothetical protein